MKSKAPLKKYQQENVDWIRREERGLLADEPGLGKSRSALEGFYDAENVLIIAPNLVLTTGVWEDEVALWGNPATNYFTASYHDLNKRVKTPKGGNKPVNVLAPEVKRNWDAIIVDESHYIKGRDSKWTWAVKDLSKRTDRILMMTGTPIPNWAHEVFTILQAIDPVEAKRGTGKYGGFWRWAEQWFDTSPTRFSNGNPVVGELLGCTPKCMQRDADDPCRHYIAFAADNFGDKYMRHLRADHLDLPPLDFIDVSTPLDADARHAYAKLKKDFAADVDGNEILAWSQGAKNVMLDKLSTSPWLLHKEGEPRGGKFENLREDLRARTRPTLVLAHYRDSVEAAARVAMAVGARAAFIHGGTTDRQNATIIRDFKHGRIDVLVGSLETLAEGLTLTVADTAIFLERSYKPSRNVQATYRIHRLGQDKACTVRRYLTPRTVDSNKEILLNTKTDRQMRTLTAAEFIRMA